MFHSRQLNEKLENTGIGFENKDAESTYREGLLPIHTKNLQYKTRNDLNASFMQEIFYENETHYNLHENNELVQPRVRSVGNGKGSVRFKGPRLRQMLP